MVSPLSHRQEPAAFLKLSRIRGIISLRRRLDKYGDMWDLASGRIRPSLLAGGCYRAVPYKKGGAGLWRHEVRMATRFMWYLDTPPVVGVCPLGRYLHLGTVGWSGFRPYGQPKMRSDGHHSFDAEIRQDIRRDGRTLRYVRTTNVQADATCLQQQIVADVVVCASIDTPSLSDRTFNQGWV